ncbi:MAG: response regulator [Candidatus Sumerlaeota bacterium]|nr:response regulator [Candidatus Sumerlaeota bacterium]
MSLSIPPTKKILVIDDEPAIAAYLCALLEDHGYSTRQAADAHAGAAAIRSERPDLVCMDIMMPGRSGVALYLDLKRDPRTAAIPVVFVSAFSRAHDFHAQRFRQLLPDERIPEPEGYLEKPIRPSAFLKAVEELTEDKRCWAEAKTP